MPKIRLAPEVVDILSTTPEPEDAPDTSLWSEDGAAGAQTTVVPPATVAAQELAWSADTEVIETESRSWASVWGQATVLLVLAAAVAVVIGILGWVAVRQDAPVVSTPSTMPAAALPPISTSAPTTTVTVAAPVPTPVFGGRYIETDTNADGRSVANVWDVNPCGDGCVDISGNGRSDRVSLLVDGGGEWTFDLPMHAICRDGSIVPRAGIGHFTIDTTTLRGTVQDNWTKEACGIPPGVATHHISMTKANQ
jgi:hypothetical protein